MTDFSTREVAEKLNVHYTSVVNWIQDGLLEARRKGPLPKSPYVISQSQLDKFIQQHPEMFSSGNHNQ